MKFPCHRLLNGTLLVMLLAGCSRPSHQETRETGYQGTARTQPFLALQRTLDRLGWQSQTIHSLVDLPSSGTLILSGDTSVKSSVARQAMDWVEQRGGHLILVMQGSETWQDDWQTDWTWIFSAGKETPSHPVLTRLGVTTSDRIEDKVIKKSKSATQNVKLGRKKLDISDHGGLTMDTTNMTEEPDVVLGSPEQASVVSVPWESGRVTIIGNATAFRNRYLDLHQNAELFVRLLLQESNPEYSSFAPVTFMLSSKETFFGLLWKQYWMALLGLVALIGAWLWKNLPRFGPLQPIPTTEMRQFSEHLLMSGNFLYHHGQTLDLFLPIRASISQKLLHRHGIHPSQSEPILLEQLANFSSLPLDRVTNAWNASFVKDARTLLTYLQDLQTIDQSL